MSISASTHIRYYGCQLGAEVVPFTFKANDGAERTVDANAVFGFGEGWTAEGPPPGHRATVAVSSPSGTDLLSSAEPLDALESRWEAVTGKKLVPRSAILDPKEAR